MTNKLAAYNWIALVTFTMFSFSLSLLGYIGPIFVTALLITAYIKGQIIIDRYMMLCTAPLMWRVIISLWLLIVLSVISLMYFLFG